MEDPREPKSAPSGARLQAHPHAPTHDHVPAQAGGHAHAQARLERKPAAPSLLMQPAWLRMLGALGLMALLWLAVAWALGAAP